MFAIVNISGKQYRVENGAQIKVPNLNSEVGSKVEFDSVLLIDDKGKLSIGSPILNGAKVSGTIMENGRDRKVIIFKKKRRKGYRRKNGHRQAFSTVMIDNISMSETKKEVAQKKKAAPKKEAAPKKKTEKKED